MDHSIEHRDQIYVKGYGFLSFTKNIDKNLNNKYCQKRLDSAKRSIEDAIKAASKRVFQKTEATGDLIGNKFADKITSASKKSSQNALKTHENETKIPKERCVSLEKKTTNHWWIKNSIINK